MVSSATPDRLRQKRSPEFIHKTFSNQMERFDFLLTNQHSHVDMVLNKVAHNKIVTELGKVHGCVLVLGQNVAVGPILQQEAHYVSVPPLASLTQKKVL